MLFFVVAANHDSSVVKKSTANWKIMGSGSSSTLPGQQRAWGDTSSKMDEDLSRIEEEERVRREKEASPQEYAASLINIVYAARDDKVADVEFVLRYAPENVNDKDATGNSALHEAARHNHVEVATMLLASGADTGSKTMYRSGRRTPLHVAAECDSLEVAGLLLKANADINLLSEWQQSPAGETPLHEAARNNSTKVVRLLLEAGAEVDCKNQAGITPLLYAVTHHPAPEVAELLYQAGASRSNFVELEENVTVTKRTGSRYKRRTHRGPGRL